METLSWTMPTDKGAEGTKSSSRDNRWDPTTWLLFTKSHNPNHSFSAWGPQQSGWGPAQQQASPVVQAIRQQPIGVLTILTLLCPHTKEYISPTIIYFRSAVFKIRRELLRRQSCLVQFITSNSASHPRKNKIGCDKANRSWHWYSG